MPKALGDLLRAAREALGVSQAQLGERVGLTPNHVNRLESSSKLNPRFETVALLAEELGLSLDQLAIACGYRKKSGFSPSDEALVRRLVRNLERLDKSLVAARGEVSSTIEDLAPQRPSRRSRRR